MKEATGETNMALVVVMIVAALAAFFYTVIWPVVKSSTDQATGCKQAVCSNRPNADGQTVQCVPKSGGNPITCPWKG